ncbi:Predicted phosphoesterase [Marinobacter daqiaonensis]|uniref:Predicted phosphoesterase n=1 Tax=Marinobacter daqiaonensis TaxID=650891 RepID=A0A1I6H0I7_9GAMM|nr:metallophosphatase domain-containing protein [Marinobacter daqiaonensis]SFR47942.1 Predicted phosphoesterase [Marinobacter daqiaonensis]
MKLVCISDTHSMHRQIPAIPKGDILIHAGDCLGAGTLNDVADLNDWLGELPHRHKIVIAGNHDWVFQEAPEHARELLTNAIYLQDSGVEIDGIRFWGSPWSPRFMDWAFMQERGEAINQYWQRIPDNTDVLITHSPPSGIGDEVDTGLQFENVGCEDLLARIHRLDLKAHIFGHIHEGYGEYLKWRIRFINASTCNVRYLPANPPIVVDVAQ